MIGFIIYIPGNETSEEAREILIRSIKDTRSAIKCNSLEAITPDQVNKLLGEYGVTWRYPKAGKEEIVHYDNKTLRVKGYEGDEKTRIGCALSHYSLWKLAIKLTSPIVILEHDARFIETFDWSYDEIANGSIIGLNDPTAATRKANIYGKQVIKATLSAEVVVPFTNQYQVEAPWVDSEEIPQGLAGNSAYVMTPIAAKKLVSLVDEYGLWPNDAIMCKQLLPDTLFQAYPYFTKVQQTKSTTVV